MTISEETINLIKNSINKQLLRIEYIHSNLYVFIKSDCILQCLAKLNSHSSLLFVALTDCFATIDQSNKGDIIIFYQLHSYKLATKIFVVAMFREDESIPSVAAIYCNADWYEKEIHERYGVFSIISAAHASVE